MLSAETIQSDAVTIEKPVGVAVGPGSKTVSASVWNPRLVVSKLSLGTGKSLLIISSPYDECFNGPRINETAAIELVFASGNSVYQPKTHPY